MKHKISIITLLVLLCANFASAQIIESHRRAAELLWSDYDQDTQNPSRVPQEIPLNISNSDIDREEIAPTYSALKNAMTKLIKNSGGIISFTNTTPTTISFDDINEAIDLQVTPFSSPYKTILIQGNNNITFNGSNKSSIFVIRRKVRLIIQNATFQNCFLKREIIQNPSRFRISGGAIEASNASSLRVYNCTFKNNSIAEWDDTPGGGYDGVGENQNGAAIRLNNGTTCEVFKCTFQNNVAVTGGAIGATSINKITIMDSSFDKNISTSYNTKNSTNRRIVEGGGAIRIDRTALPVEIYRTSFTENAANIKTSVIEVFIRPLRVNGAETGAYPGPNGNALIIDDCIFKNNKYYNFQGANDPDRSSFFAGVILFHGGGLNNNFLGATMKVSNTKFIGNDISESHIRGLLSYDVNNSIFANANFLRLRDGNNNFRTGKAALMLRGEPKKITINKCTFYNNNPNPDDRTNSTASDIFFWGNAPSNATLNNSIFYRTNTNQNYKQVAKPMTGSGNNQFVPGADMNLFTNVSVGSVTKIDPNIVPGNIIDMCLDNNSLPLGIGGLPDCGSNPPPPPGPTGIAIPGTIQAENFITKNGDVRAENTPGGGQNLGFIKNKNYTEYDIKVASAGTYKLDAFTSSNGKGGNIVVSVGGVDLATLVVPVNNSWHTYNIPITTNLDLNAGLQKIRFTYTGLAGFLFNFDRAELSENTSTPPPPEPTSIAIPGTIQVESFITKNGDVRAESTPGGGQNLGFIKDKNYTEYDIKVASAGTYKLDAFTSSNGKGGNIVVSVGGVDLATLVVPVNNSWHAYDTPVTANLDLNAGLQKIRFTYTGSAGFLFNFDRAEFNLDATTPVTLNCSNAPSGLKMTTASSNSITFSFDNSSVDTRRFELRAFLQGAFSGNINSGAISYAAAEAGSSFVTIGGLQSGTSYDFVFRSLCAGSSPGVSSLAPVVTAATSGTKIGKGNQLGIIVQNPVRGSNLEVIGNIKNVTYKLYNLSGQIIKKGTLSTTTLSIENLSKGIYLLELNKGIKRKVLKAVIQ